MAEKRDRLKGKKNGSEKKYYLEKCSVIPHESRLLSSSTRHLPAIDGLKRGRSLGKLSGTLIVSKNLKKYDETPQ